MHPSSLGNVVGRSVLFSYAREESLLCVQQRCHSMYLFRPSLQACGFASICQGTDNANAGAQAPPRHHSIAWKSSFLFSTRVLYNQAQSQNVENHASLAEIGKKNKRNSSHVRRFWCRSPQLQIIQAQQVQTHGRNLEVHKISRVRRVCVSEAPRSSTVPQLERSCFSPLPSDRMGPTEAAATAPWHSMASYCELLVYCGVQGK